LCGQARRRHRERKSARRGAPRAGGRFGRLVAFCRQEGDWMSSGGRPAYTELDRIVEPRGMGERGKAEGVVKASGGGSRECGRPQAPGLRSIGSFRLPQRLRFMMSRYSPASCNLHARLALETIGIQILRNCKRICDLQDVRECLRARRCRSGRTIPYRRTSCPPGFASRSRRRAIATCSLFIKRLVIFHC